MLPIFLEHLDKWLMKLTTDLVANDDDLMPADLMTCEATVDTLVKLDPNR